VANEDLFEELRSHLGAFIITHNELKNDYALLQKEIVELKEELTKKDEQFSNFQNQQKLSNIASSVVGKEGDSAQLKHKINEYIKEIDRCIIHLKQ
jgi:predicted  nucleic acid-binding Zn-ribbon protein